MPVHNNYDNLKEGCSSSPLPDCSQNTGAILNQFSSSEKHAFTIYPDDLALTKKNQETQTRNCLITLSIRNRSNIVSFFTRV